MFIGFIPFVFLLTTVWSIVRNKRQMFIQVALANLMMLFWALFHCSHHLSQLATYNW